MSERGQSPGVGESWRHARPGAERPAAGARSAFPSASRSGNVFHGQGKGFVSWQGKGRGFQRQSLPTKGKGKGTFKGKGSNSFDRRYGKGQGAQWGKGNVLPASHSLDLPERLQGVLRYIRSTTRNRAPSTAAAASHACQGCWKGLTRPPPQAKSSFQGFQSRCDNKTVSSPHREKQVASLSEDPRSDPSPPSPSLRAGRTALVGDKGPTRSPGDHRSTGLGASGPSKPQKGQVNSRAPASTVETTEYVTPAVSLDTQRAIAVSCQVMKGSWCKFGRSWLSVPGRDARVGQPIQRRYPGFQWFPVHPQQPTPP